MQQKHQTGITFIVLGPLGPFHLIKSNVGDPAFKFFQLAAIENW